MPKNFYLYIDGQKVPVSEELYREYRRFLRKERYFSVDLKAERFIYDPDKRIALLLPGREDSYDRILEQSGPFAAAAEVSPEDAAVKADLLERLDKALHTLSDQELDLIQELFFLEKTEREAGEALHMARSTLHDRKNAVLRKLREKLENSF